VDVAVIGGGITGLSAARVLAKRGVTVAVLEAQTIGWGASSRNGGMVLTGLKLGAAALTARYGVELARQLFKASLDAVDAVEEVVKHERIDCQFRHDGHLALASKPAHYQRFKESADVLAREFGMRFDSWRRRISAMKSARVPITAGHRSGERQHQSGAVRGGARESGAGSGRRPAGSDARQRNRAVGSRWQLSTSRGRIEAANVLVATSGYTGAITPGLRRRIVPLVPT